MKQILPALDASPIVFRYAWMSARGDVRALLGNDADGKSELTALGHLYNILKTDDSNNNKDSDKFPWLNVSLPMEKRLSTLVAAMNDTELMSQLVKYSQRIDRLKVPAYAWHMEAAHGVATGGT